MVLQRASRAARGTTTFVGARKFPVLYVALAPSGSHTSTVCPDIERIACVGVFAQPVGSRERDPLEHVAEALNATHDYSPCPLPRTCLALYPLSDGTKPTKACDIALTP